ncbi:carbamate kinase [Clostridium sp. Marseille-P299]|uniref:carbamate kinase n=1 Tax=Clostridium sp. Marseille-P299 TaxID=1805477 RepID=UPI000835103A|nr:carbamate kinase [Clostridium sp. Marseille-P299]
MKKQTLVVALGRSAFGETFPEQRKNVSIAAKAIADLVEANYKIVITHSNGPQVGMVHTAMTEFSRLDDRYTVAPMSLCGAMSQGYIGFDLQNAIRTELLNRGIFKPVSTIITQVKVDPFDKAFSNPSKVIGRYMTKEEAEAEERKGNYVVEEEKGFRRIIAAPNPMDIYEIDAIKALVDADQIVIAGGGGGIPVLEQGTVLKGASAIIEKDLTAAKLAELLHADTLLFLTGVEKVALNYGTENEKFLDSITSEEAAEYMKDGYFAKGAMLPKVSAAVSFVNEDSSRKAIITKIDRAIDALAGKTGTVITK